eukprot:6423724-Pyramimonas_sp.AAC.1
MFNIKSLYSRPTAELELNHVNVETVLSNTELSGSLRKSLARSSETRFDIDTVNVRVCPLGECDEYDNKHAMFRGSRRDSTDHVEIGRKQSGGESKSPATAHEGLVTLPAAGGQRGGNE